MVNLRYTIQSQFRPRLPEHQEGSEGVPRFFVPKEDIGKECVAIRGADAHHISRSLRMAVGEEITVADGEGHAYRCVLSGFSADEVHARITECLDEKREPPCHLTLCQALPKGDKLDLVIQKAVECGVSLIVPFESEHCVVRRKADSEAAKSQRRNRIAREAAGQCGRSLVPRVGACVSFPEMLVLAKEADLALFCYEGEGTVPIGRILSDFSPAPGARIVLAVGSEGGFSVAESEAARRAGWRMTGLGPRILRTETAALFALSAISTITELG